MHSSISAAFVTEARADDTLAVLHAFEFSRLGGGFPGSHEGIAEAVSLRAGEVTLLSIEGANADRLIQEGYPVLYDMDDYYKGLGHWPPGKVIVATRTERPCTWRSCLTCRSRSTSSLE